MVETCSTIDGELPISDGEKSCEIPASLHGLNITISIAKKPYNIAKMFSLCVLSFPACPIRLRHTTLFKKKQKKLFSVFGDLFFPMRQRHNEGTHQDVVVHVGLRQGEHVPHIFSKETPLRLVERVERVASG